MSINANSGDAPIIDVIDGNKLIAVSIMGGEINKNFPAIIDFKQSPTNTSGCCMSLDDLKYHSSWDWLIPAWGKFMVMLENTRFSDTNNNAKIAREHLPQRFLRFVNDNEILHAFNILVTSTEWYNQTNQQ